MIVAYKRIYKTKITILEVGKRSYKDEAIAMFDNLKEAREFLSKCGDEGNTNVYISYKPEDVIK